MARLVPYRQDFQIAAVAAAFAIAASFPVGAAECLGSDPGASFHRPAHAAERTLDRLIKKDSSDDNMFLFEVKRPDRDSRKDKTYRGLFTPALENAWAEAEAALVRQDRGGKYSEEGEICGMRSVCRIDLPRGRFIVPDGLAFFDTGTKKRAVAIEFHNFPDTGRAVKQLVGHMEPLELDAYSSFFGHIAAGRVLSISSDPGLAVRVMDRMLALPGFRDSRAFQLIAFNTLESVKADFGSGWVLADRTPANVFE